MKKPKVADDAQLAKLREALETKGGEFLSDDEKDAQTDSIVSSLNLSFSNAISRAISKLQVETDSHDFYVDFKHMDELMQRYVRILVFRDGEELVEEVSDMEKLEVLNELKIPNSVLERLVVDEKTSEELLLKILSHRSSGDSVVKSALKRLALSEDWQIRKMVARDARTEITTVMSFENDEKVEVRYESTLNEKVSNEYVTSVLKKLSVDDSKEGRFLAASDTRIDSEILDYLVDDEDLEVVYAVAANPNASNELFRNRLMAEVDLTVYAAANPRLELSHSNYSEDLLREFFIRISDYDGRTNWRAKIGLAKMRMPAFVFKELANDGERAVRVTLADNEKIEEESFIKVLEELAVDGDLGVRYFARKNLEGRD